jgi:hypothetical protein
MKASAEKSLKCALDSTGITLANQIYDIGTHVGTTSY